MSKLSDFMPATSRVPGDMLRGLVEQRFAQYLQEIREKAPTPGQRLQDDLKALVRPFITDPGVADYLGFMLMVALVQDTGINRVVPMYNEIVPEANLGIDTRHKQRARRLGKPATADDYDLNRNAKIRQRHARLVADGRHDATTAVGKEFGLSARQISRILRAAPKK